MISVDIVFVSHVKNNEVLEITENAILSLFKSEDNIEFFVYIIESGNYDYTGIHKNIVMVNPEPPFNYHKYLNIGRRLGSSEYVCLCNNDVVFHKNWATNIINAISVDESILSASPSQLTSNDGIIYGYGIGRELKGWCIFQRRKIYDLINDLPEDVVFYSCDNDYARLLKSKQIPHVQVKNSKVHHYVGVTYKLLPSDKQIEYGVTKGIKIVKNKWGEFN